MFLLNQLCYGYFGCNDSKIASIFRKKLVLVETMVLSTFILNFSPLAFNTYETKTFKIGDDPYSSK